MKHMRANKVIADIVKAFKPLNLKPTHYTELMYEIKKALQSKQAEVSDIRYLLEGITANIKDFDGQRYKITITPNKE